MDFLSDLRSFPLTVLRPGQSWDPCSSCIIIGPSPVDLSAHLMGEHSTTPSPSRPSQRERQIQSAIRLREKEFFGRWRGQASWKW